MPLALMTKSDADGRARIWDLGHVYSASFRFPYVLDNVLLSNGPLVSHVPFLLWSRT